MENRAGAVEYNCLLYRKRSCRRDSLPVHCLICAACGDGTCRLGLLAFGCWLGFRGVGGIVRYCHAAWDIPSTVQRPRVTQSYCLSIAQIRSSASVLALPAGTRNWRLCALCDRRTCSVSAADIFILLVAGDSVPDATCCEPFHPCPCTFLEPPP